MPLQPPFVWSPDGSVYPSGSDAWSSQPVALAPPGQWWTPNLPIDAEEMNYVLGQVTDDMVALQEHTLALSLGWCPSFNTNGSLAFGTSALAAACWDPSVNLWVTLQCNASGSPAAHVFVTYGLDQAAGWAQIGSGITSTSNNWYAGAVCHDPAAAGRLLIAGVDSANTLAIYNWNLSAWSLAFSSGAYTYYGVQLAVLGSVVICAASTSGSGDNDIVSSSNDFSTHNSFSSGIAMSAGTNWLLESNGTIALAIPRMSGEYTVFYTSDGVTWTPESGLSSIIASGNTVVGLVWSTDAEGPCWIVAAQSASGQPFWCRSSDGITWNTQAGGVTTNMVVTSMASLGNSLLVCQLGDASSGGASGQIFSVDGGVTWYQSPSTFASSQAHPSNGYIQGQVVASDTNFLAFNNLNARFSNPAALPSTPL